MAVELANSFWGIIGCCRQTQDNKVNIIVETRLKLDKRSTDQQRILVDNMGVNCNMADCEYNRLPSSVPVGNWDWTELCPNVRLFKHR